MHSRQPRVSIANTVTNATKNWPALHEQFRQLSRLAHFLYMSASFRPTGVCLSLDRDEIKKLAADSAKDVSSIAAIQSGGAAVARAVPVAG